MFNRILECSPVVLDFAFQGSFPFSARLLTSRLCALCSVLHLQECVHISDLFEAVVPGWCTMVRVLLLVPFTWGVLMSCPLFPSLAGLLHRPTPPNSMSALLISERLIHFLSLLLFSILSSIYAVCFFFKFSSMFAFVLFWFYLFFSFVVRV